jgi:hypothetical protein
MRFENLMKQTLQLIKSRNVIIKTRKTDYKTKKTTTLMKKMKSIIKKNVNEYFINLLKTTKSQDEESILNVDVKLNDLIKIMRKMTMNVDNLINCVFLSNERNHFKSNQFYSSQMLSRYFQSSQLFMFDSKSFSMSLQNMFFQNISFSTMFSLFLNNKSRVRSLINAFTAMKRIIYTKETALSSTRSLRLRMSICTRTSRTTTKARSRVSY